VGRKPLDKPRLTVRLFLRVSGNKGHLTEFTCDPDDEPEVHKQFAAALRNCSPRTQAAKQGGVR